MRSTLLLISLFLLTGFGPSSAPAKEKERPEVLGAVSEEKNHPGRVKIMGNVIKSALENYHYRGMKIDNAVSEKAFTMFLEKVDYGKQFLTQEDIKKLRQYRFSMDDQMVSGEIEIIDDTIEIMKKRLVEVEAIRKEVMGKPFDFSKSETLELDPEKRDFPKNLKALKEHWRKLLKQSVLRRYLSYLEDPDQVDEKKSKKKKEKKSKKDKDKEKDVDIAEQMKKLSNKEKKRLREKARESIAKKYRDFLHRLEREKYDDYLDRYYNSVAGIYDPHTNYLPPKRKEDFDIDISGSLEGIGAVLSEDGAFIKVVRIVPGGAAWRQKELGVDDVIMTVQDENTEEPVDLVDMRVDEAVRFIRGKKGTEVTLKVKKPDGTKKSITIVRDVVQIEASFTKSSIIEHDSLKNFKIGYIQVPKFYRNFGDASERNCSEDVRKEVEQLKKKNVNGIILDLRNNGGGALEDARIMSGLFIKKGPIVQVREHTGKIKVLSDNDSSVQYDGPLVVLINRFSASASEIVAAALQDYGRAIIVGGEFSHGKGTVQAILDLNAGPIMSMFAQGLGALKVTIQKFYRVNGNSTQYRGVTPDIIIPDPYAYGENREQDLDYSLPWDEVDKLSYAEVKKDLKLSKLKKLSQKRVAKNERFQKINKMIKYLEDKRNDTKVSLQIDKVIKEDKNNKDASKKFEYDEKNTKIKVSAYEKSLKGNNSAKKTNKKKWEEDYKQRSKEWVESLQKDPGLEEALFILNDYVSKKA